MYTMQLTSSSSEAILFLLEFSLNICDNLLSSVNSVHCEKVLVAY